MKVIGANDGQVLGEWQLGFQPRESPTLYKTSLLLLSAEGELISVSLDQFREGETAPIAGVPLWKGTDPGIYVGHTPLVMGEVAYYGTTYGRFNEDIDSPDAKPNRVRGYRNYCCALNLETGRLMWQTEIPGTERDISDVEYAPTYINGYLYVASHNGLILKLDPRNGNIDWQIDLTHWDRWNYSAYPPVPFDGRLIVAAQNGVYLVREPQSSTTK